MTQQSTQKSSPKESVFDWIPFYEELADKLVAYQNRQSELIDFLDNLRSQGLKTTPLEDRDDTGARFKLKEIDPFTFFGSFNRQLSNETRFRILRAIKSHFDISATVPTSLTGIPVVNNQSSWFFGYYFRRKPGDVARLWKVFTLALEPSSLNNPEFSQSFDEAVAQYGVNINLTMGLFWIRPSKYLSLDANNCEYFHIKLPSAGLTFKFYNDVLEQTLKDDGANIALLSSKAWEASKTDAATRRTRNKGQIRTDIEYWIVGAHWEGQEPADQTARFLAEGIWENGSSDQNLDVVKSMKVGDRIAIKAVSTQKLGLPFDNRGKTVSCMKFKARGTIVANTGDGRIVEVDWEPNPEERVWYFYTNRTAIWHVKKEDELAQRLIRFVFNDEPQDLDFFQSVWATGPSAAEEESRANNEPASKVIPYAVADVISAGVFLSEPDIELALRRLRIKKNLVLQGPPGVGKTFVAKHLAFALMEEKDEKRVRIVQFHPSFSYEDFIRGIRPSNDAARFSICDGPFQTLCKDAINDPERKYVLIIDEVNRGNLSQIFGELFMLLEADKRGKDHQLIPLYRLTDDERFYIPENIYVIGTMNIADRSLALVDFALRRRFAFLTLTPGFSNPAFKRWLTVHGMSEQLIDHISGHLNQMNQRISEDQQLGPNFCIGHSFFCPQGKDFSSLGLEWYHEIIETEIIPLLQEYWYDTPDKVESARQLLE